MAFSKIIFNGNTLMDVTGDNPTASKMLAGTTATGSDGQKVNGSFSISNGTLLGQYVGTETMPAGTFINFQEGRDVFQSTSSSFDYDSFMIFEDIFIKISTFASNSITYNLYKVNSNGTISTLKSNTSLTITGITSSHAVSESIMMTDDTFALTFVDSGSGYNSTSIILYVLFTYSNNSITVTSISKTSSTYGVTVPTSSYFSIRPGNYGCSKINDTHIVHFFGTTNDSSNSIYYAIGNFSSASTTASVRTHSLTFNSTNVSLSNSSTIILFPIANGIIFMWSADNSTNSFCYKYFTFSSNSYYISSTAEASMNRNNSYTTSKYKAYILDSINSAYVFLTGSSSHKMEAHYLTVSNNTITISSILFDCGKYNINHDSYIELHPNDPGSTYPLTNSIHAIGSKTNSNEFLLIFEMIDGSSSNYTAYLKFIKFVKDSNSLVFSYNDVWSYTFSNTSINYNDLWYLTYSGNQLIAIARYSMIQRPVYVRYNTLINPDETIECVTPASEIIDGITMSDITRSVAGDVYILDTD